MSGEKVVALPGFSVPTGRGEPVKSVVDILRRFLEQAEAGQIQAVAIAGVLVTDPVSSPSTETDFSAPRHSYVLDASIGRMTRRFHESFDK